MWVLVIVIAFTAFVSWWVLVNTPLKPVQPKYRVIQLSNGNYVAQCHKLVGAGIIHSHCAWVDIDNFGETGTMVPCQCNTVELAEANIVKRKEVLVDRYSPNVIKVIKEVH